MVKKSNPFQQLVHRIHRACEGPDAKVEESYQESDPDGVAREIDIRVEKPVDGVSLVTAIECRDHGRKATIQWIDEVVGKYDDLGVDRIVLVNRRGFAESAKKKAGRYGVQLWTLDEISDENWPGGLPKLWIVPYKESVRHVVTTHLRQPLRLRGGFTVTPMWLGWNDVQAAVHAEYLIQRERQADEIQRQRPTVAHLSKGIVEIGFSLPAPTTARYGFSYDVPPSPDTAEWGEISSLSVRSTIRAAVAMPEHKRYVLENIGSPALYPARSIVEVSIGGGRVITLVHDGQGHSS